MIYYLHEDAAECSKMLADTDLAKQIKAIAQALCDLHHAITLKQPVDKKYHIPMLYKFSNEKIMEWLVTCRANYLKLADMGIACCEEYCYRLNKNPGYSHKEHKLLDVIIWARNNVPSLPRVLAEQKYGLPRAEFSVTPTVHNVEYDYIESTTFPLCVSDKYKTEMLVNYHDAFTDETLEQETIKSYRNYYRAQLEKLADRHIKCKFDTHDRDVKAYGRCAECLTRSGSVPKPIVPTWTRRERPEFLNEVN